MSLFYLGPRLFTYENENPIFAESTGSFLPNFVCKLLGICYFQHMNASAGHFLFLFFFLLVFFFFFIETHFQLKCFTFVV